MWQFKKDTVIKWYYYDGDEFSQSYPDTIKWYPHYSYADMNYQFGFLMTSKRMVLEDGICKFMAYRDSGLYEVPGWQLPTFEKDYKMKLTEGKKVKYKYTLGTVWSRTAYGKGYFEIRFKSTPELGMWPGFWMYGQNQKDEIDFFELKGEKKKEVHIDVHCPYGCDDHYKSAGPFKKNFGGWVQTTEDLTSTYNILAGEWQDGYVKWYLNGTGIGYFKGDFASQKMNLIAGIGLAVQGGPFAPGVTNKTVFPNSLDVDYIRVWYKERTSNEEIKGIKHKTFDYYKTAVGKSRLRKKLGNKKIRKEFKNDVLTVSLLPSSQGKFILSATGDKIDYSLTVKSLDGQTIKETNVTEAFFELNLTEAKNKVIVIIKCGDLAISEQLDLY